ncbi:MAG: hypothetical protein IRZ16_11540 [Myxococcaceae bacterium]|nr:hypothetical protein [Myxococcaceae bacterium]
MRLLSAIAAASLLASCALGRASDRPAPAQPGAPAEPPPEQVVFADSSAPAAGADGTQAHPFRTLASALAAVRPPATVRLAVGLYLGEAVVPGDVRIEGERTAVIYAGGTGTTLRLEDGASLHGLTVQGGAVGAEVKGAVRIEEVAFSGQRQRAIAVSDHGALALIDADIEGTVSETRGVVLEEGARAEVTGGRFHGGLRIGVEAKAGTSLRVDHAVFDGPVVALKADRSDLAATGLRISGGRGPAISLSGTRASLRDIVIHGHEYGLLANAGAVLDVRDFTTVRAERAGIGGVEVRGEIDGLVALDSGNFGAVQLISSTATVRRFIIARAQNAGISVNGGDVTLIDGSIVDVSDPADAEGDGVSVRHAGLRGTALTEARVSGTGVLAAEASRVAVAEAAIASARYGGLHAETRARLDAVSAIVRGGGNAALVVLHDARLRADALETAQNAQGLLWAECGAGAEVWLGRVRGAEAHAVHAACAGRWLRPALLDPFATEQPDEE